MDVLKGLLLINDVDIFTDYGAFLVEEKPVRTRTTPHF